MASPSRKQMDAFDIPAVRVEDFEIPGVDGCIAVRAYRPATARATAQALPVVLYFHGGGFVGGSIDDADVPARFIATHCPAEVLAVDYALAPARPFPAAPEDAYAAACWAARWTANDSADDACTAAGNKVRRIGSKAWHPAWHQASYQARRIAVAGDDAGGNLAASLPLIARDRNGPVISAQVLIGPMLDPSMTRLGDAARLKSDLSAQACAACYRQYLPSTQQRLHPYAAPLESRRLGGLPAALIVTAECDVLHEEAEKYAASLIAVGVHTQVARFAGMTHAALREHRPALAEAADFLRRRLLTGDSAAQSPSIKEDSSNAL